MEKALTIVAILTLGVFCFAAPSYSCVAKMTEEYADGSYSVAEISCGEPQMGSCEKYLQDASDGKVRNIGELTCFDEQGRQQVYKNLASDR